MWGSVVIFRSQKGSANKNVPVTLPYPVPIQHSFPQSTYTFVPFPARAKNFFFWKHPDRRWGLAILLFNGYWGLVLPEGERLKREADLTPSSNAEVKNECSYTVASPHICMAYTGTPLPINSIFGACSTEVTKFRLELFHLPTLMHSSLFINNMYVTLLSSTCFEH